MFLQHHEGSLNYLGHIACLLVVRGVSPGCRLFGTDSVVESFSVEFLYLKSSGPGRTGAEPLQKIYCVLLRMCTSAILLFMI